MDNVTPLNTATQQSYSWHAHALSLGLIDTIPVMPPWAELHEHSKVDPKARGKVPCEYYGGAFDGMGSWPSYQMDAVKVARWDQNGTNVGLKMGKNWCALDVDITDDVTAQAMFNRIDELGGGRYFIRWGAVPKFLVLFRIAPGETIRRKQYPIKRNGETQRVEVMGLTAREQPTQAVIFGVHPSGREYQWNRWPQADQVQTCTLAQMDMLVEEMLKVAESRGWTRGKATNVHRMNDGISRHGAQPADQSLFEPVCDLIPNDDLEYDEWIAVAYAMKNAMGDVAWPVFAKWSAKAPKDDPKVTLRTWQGFKPDGGNGFGKLVFLARQACGGQLPGNLDRQVRNAARLAEASKAGMPAVAPVIASQQPVTAAEYYAYDSKGNLVPNMHNVYAYLINQDHWRERLYYDAFTNRYMIWDKGTFRELNDNDYTAIRSWFQRNVFNKIGKADVIDAIELAATRNTREPVQEYLSGVQWDGVPRIGSWLTQYCGVTSQDLTHLTYINAVGRKWLISAVARAMEPGSQADYCLIFEGPQGRGKSSALRALVPYKEWFSDSLPDFHQKDAAEHLDGVWLVEMAELTSVYRSELESMRSFITRRVERYRESYGRRTGSRPRRCVFAGSTNRNDYLKDHAGERRFWIVQTDGQFLIADLKAVRDQLWAEAYAAYQSGEQWYLDPAIEAIATQVQKQRVAAHPWMDTLAGLLAQRTRTTVGECFALMGLAVKDQNPRKQQDMIGCLEGLGFVNKGRQTSGPYRSKTLYQRG